VRAWQHILEIEKLGGMVKAIETGLPKMRIEESAARIQARIDSGDQAILGVNLYPYLEPEDIPILKVDNSTVRQTQIDRLQVLRSSRDQIEVERHLEALTKAAESGEGNLLELSVAAARAKATVGEISLALEKVWGRHQAIIRSISGVYLGEATIDSQTKEQLTQALITFEQREGRRPRILVAKMGQDGHDRGQKVIATAFADLGFDVDIGPLFQTPEETARQAVENDVHIVGVSSLAAGHLTLIPQLRESLAKMGRADIMLVVGGVIPSQDHDILHQAGVSAIFGPGTVIAHAALQIIEQLQI
jgi:methylmalonyl-CoA mutase